MHEYFKFWINYFIRVKKNKNTLFVHLWLILNPFKKI